MTSRRNRTWIIVLLLVSCSLGVTGQGTKPLGKGIQDIADRIAQNQQQITDENNAVQGYVLGIGKTIYAAYGQERDPGRLLIDLKEITEQTLETIEAARTGKPAAAQAAQLVLDYWAEINPTINNINAGQQITWQLAPLIETLWERNNYQTQIATDIKILANLQAESGSLGAQNTTPVAEQPQTTPVTVAPPTRNFDFSTLDDAVLVNRWLDMGNRAFSDPAEEVAFYKKNPVFDRFRNVAETMSPRTDVEQAGVLKQLSVTPVAKEPAKPTAACVDRSVITSQLQQYQACNFACYKLANPYSCYPSCDALKPDNKKPTCQ